MILFFLAETHAGPNLNFSKIGSFIAMIYVGNNPNIITDILEN
jgi:hypothetical protein